MVDLEKESVRQHGRLKGVLETKTKMRVRDKNDLGIVYWPGVLEVCKEIAKNKQKMYDFTMKSNTILVVSDGSSASSLGNVGEAVAPMNEGKALLYKDFSEINAVPITLKTQDTQEIIKTIRNISPGFGAICLEGIAAPKSFEIEDALQDVEVPIFNENEHGTAVTVVAAIINACKAVGKKTEDTKVVINGAGAAGIGIARLLLNAGRDKKNKKIVREIIVCDSKGILYDGREDMNPYKQDIAKQTNSKGFRGGLATALIGADIFVGVSVPKVISPNMIRAMATDPIIFALAWPTPELMPDEAKRGGAAIVASGRTELQNPIHNILAFPGIIKGCMEAEAKKLNYEMLSAATFALAKMIAKPTSNKILPNAMDKQAVKKIAAAVKQAAILSKVARK